MIFSRLNAAESNLRGLDPDLCFLGAAGEDLAAGSARPLVTTPHGFYFARTSNAHFEKCFFIVT
ncbi:MAG: hypothetical protein D3909_16850 [Candidatus Electrothrix sp. ATG1]|nr:hypothetical protein [Candidatus Electrothrix sp. ATG1]